MKQKAASLGFALCGITGPLPKGKKEFYEWWVDQGFGAGMHYLRVQKNRRKHIKALLPRARSVVICAMRFPGSSSEAPTDLEKRAYGKIARYANQDDYHDRILPLLQELAHTIDAAAGVKESKAYVDTGPLSERAFAALAGVGWVGKNSLLIHPEEGSWFWLGEVVTAAELELDEPMADHCGKCRRCIDSCPTGAILENLRAVDSRKCLSYWNIEHRGEIPTELHKSMGQWLLGCDICQEVCPWNQHSLRKARSTLGEPPVEYVAVDELLLLTPEEFATRYKGRALERARLSGIQRNARIVKKNFENGNS